MSGDAAAAVGTDDTVVLTGGTSGIGRAAARRLADRGATVAIVGRNEERGRSVVEAAADAPGEVAFHRADLADLAAVRDLADDLHDSYGAVDVLVNNAGLASSDRVETPQDYELTFAVNHLAAYLLTHELWPALRAADGTARVVTTASDLHRRGDLDFDDLHLEAGYDGLDAYARSKLANIAFTLELAERCDDAEADVVANCFSPGFIRGTRIWTGASWRSRLLTWLFALPPWIGTDVDTGAERMVAVAADAPYGTRSGRYVDEGEEKPPSEAARDPELRQRLWTESARLVDVDPDWP